MNILLQFKQKSHSEAYDHDLQLQVTKRLIMVVIWALIQVFGTIANLVTMKVMIMTAFDISKMATIFVLLAGLIVLRCKLQKVKKYLSKINIVLDVCLIWAQFILFPYVGKNGLDSFGKLGVFTLSWCVCLGCYSTYFAVANWWLRAIVPILQIIFFLVPTIQQEILWPFILVFAIECMVIYVAFIYVYELYQRKDFLEKRKVYENYEALMQIFDDIIQGVMIVDTNYNLIYSNRTIGSLISYTQNTRSLESLFSDIQVKSMTPRLEAFMTEPIQMFCEPEDSVTISCYLSAYCKYMIGMPAYLERLYGRYLEGPFPSGFT